MIQLLNVHGLPTLRVPQQTFRRLRCRTQTRQSDAICRHPSSDL